MNTPMQWAAAAAWQQKIMNLLRVWIAKPCFTLLVTKKGYVCQRDFFLVYHLQTSVTGTENILTIQLNLRPTLVEPNSPSTMQKKIKG